MKALNYAIGYDTPLVRKIRQLETYSVWRMLVLNRDNFTCQQCFLSGIKLHVDHFPESFAYLIIFNKIKSLKAAEKCNQLWNVKNGRTLCVDCHKMTKNYGRNYS